MSQNTLVALATEKKNDCEANKCNFSVAGMCCDGVPFCESIVKCDGLAGKADCYKYLQIDALNELARRIRPIPKTRSIQPSGQEEIPEEAELCLLWQQILAPEDYLEVKEEAVFRYGIRGVRP